MADTTVIGAADNGRDVSVRVGDLVVLQLPENPTTGYRWSVQAAGSLALVADSFSAGNAGPGMGGVRRLEWRATTPGTNELVLLQRRDWESSGQEIGSFRASIVIAPR